MFALQAEELAKIMVTSTSFVDEETGETLHALCLSNLDGDALLVDTSCRDDIHLADCERSLRVRIAKMLEQILRKTFSGESL